MNRNDTKLIELTCTSCGARNFLAPDEYKEWQHAGGWFFCDYTCKAEYETREARGEHLV